jgi:hypothetical protein
MEEMGGGETRTARQRLFSPKREETRFQAENKHKKGATIKKVNAPDSLRKKGIFTNTDRRERKCLKTSLFCRSKNATLSTVQCPA